MILLNNLFYVLAVKVKPKSVRHKTSLLTCDTGFMEIPADKITNELQITYSYSVKFEVSFIFILLNIYDALML